MNLHPHERCTCARTLVSGRRYFRYKHCLRCSFLIPRSHAEELALQAEEGRLAAAQREREREWLDELQTRAIVERKLSSRPDLSIGALRAEVSMVGNSTVSDRRFAELVGEVKDGFGIDRLGRIGRRVS